MLKNKNKDENRSLMRRISPVLCVLTGGLVFSLLINCAAIVHTRHEQNRYAMMAVKANMDSMDREISAVTRNQAKMVIDYTQGEGTLYTPLTMTLNASDKSLEQLQGQEQLNNVFSIYFFDYAAQFHFFLYFPDRDQYIACDTSPEGKKMGAAITNLIKERRINEDLEMAGWSIVAEDSETYLIKTLKYQNIRFGYWLTAKDMVDLMSSLSDAKEDSLILTNLDGEILTGIPGEVEASLDQTGFFSEYIEIQRTFDKLPFAIRYFIPVSRMFQNILWLQMILAAITIGTAAGLIFYFYYTVRHIIRPIQTFCEGLSCYGGENLPELDSAKILELEQADQQFRNLAEQIRSLKISLYEQQMEQQKEVIEFMKLQIRPHFYLNCLNLAYNMVELEKYDECRQMLRLTSEYFRYLLKSDMRKELIKDELTYVKNYLKIQSIRYRRTFNYYIEQDPRTLDCYIPPLIIQTFVENAVKNTVALERPVDISITVMEENGEEEPVIHIFITDTGDGFSEEILGRIKRGESLQRDNGTGIGIANSIKRLQYHFGGECRVRFYNSPQGGAVVELTIPVCRKTEREE